MKCVDVIKETNANIASLREEVRDNYKLLYI